jgi:glycosyltransferase involved in cell wall biosynthesis
MASGSVATAARRAPERARILVVEPHATGHHATYLRWIVEAVAEQGWRPVVLTTAHALEHPLLAQLQTDRGVEVRAIEFPSPGSAAPGVLAIVRSELVHWWAIRRVVRAEVARSGVAAVVLPYVDYCFFACCVLGMPDSSVPWHVISMRLSAADTARASGVPWKWRLTRSLLSAAALRTVFAISPSVRALPEGWLTGAMAARLRYLPDPAEQRSRVERDAARGRLGLAPDRVAILVFGSVDERKGLGRLVEALAVEAALEPYVLVVAGKRSAALDRMLAAPLAVLRDRQRLIELNHVLDDAEQALVFAAADVVWLGYERHAFMSGVLVLAGQAGLPVVATDEGEVGAFVRGHDMGPLIEPQGGASVSAALRALLEEPARRRWGERAAAAVAEHTPENLQRALVAALGVPG